MVVCAMGIGSARVEAQGTACQVDKPAILAPEGPQPIYPDSLRIKKVEGEFLASFIIAP